MVRDARTEMGSFSMNPHEDENLGTSDNPRHREPGFVPVHEIPDTDGMDPEAMLLAKEAGEFEE